MDDLKSLWSAPGTRIELRTTLTSPFGRKVRMAALRLGLADRITRRDADTLDANDDLRDQNPLGKIPCLLMDEQLFYDSTVIVEMLNTIAGGTLIPAVGLARYRCLTTARLADGITDAALLMVYEGRFRTPEQASEIWMEHQSGKITRTLAGFEAAPPDPERADLGSFALSCALGYLDWRQPVAWRGDHPRLVRWLDAFSAATPEFSATERMAS